MKISELKDKEKIDIIDVKLIFDLPVHIFYGKKTKSVAAVDIDNIESKPSVLIDLYGDDIDKFKQGDKLRAINCIAKLTFNKKYGEQFIISPGYFNGQLIGKYEKIEEGK